MELYKLSVNQTLVQLLLLELCEFEVGAGAGAASSVREKPNILQAVFAPFTLSSLLLLLTGIPVMGKMEAFSSDLWSFGRVGFRISSRGKPSCTEVEVVLTTAGVSL